MALASLSLLANWAVLQVALGIASERKVRGDFTPPPFGLPGGTDHPGQRWGWGRAPMCTPSALTGTTCMREERS